MTFGKVYLIGAGPGDPDLITRKGFRLIQSADVVVYDRLIPHELLEETRHDALLIDGGKQPKKHRLSQDEINNTIITHALAGKIVARLKGGDPLIFGRGSEEAIACYQYGIPFEIVPGISSSYSVPAYAGIPLTHRHVSSSFTVITGHEAPNKSASSINYQALAKLGGTLVILMGVKQLNNITRTLISHGLSPHTPAATIEWGTTQEQRTLIGTVGTIADLAVGHMIRPPAITVIGEVVKLREQGTRWFDLLPAEIFEPQGLPSLPEHRLQTSIFTQPDNFK